MLNDLEVMRGRVLQLGGHPRHSPDNRVRIAVENVSFWYGTKQVLDQVSIDIHANEVIAFLGPSGCGKTTLLRCFNRTNEVTEGARMSGRILLDGVDINGPEVEATMLRRRFGWIAQQPNPFPRSIRDNILYGPRTQGLLDHGEDQDELVERALRAAGLWDEVKDRLDRHGDHLSIGQQQRLCIARAIATDPEVVLMDEPCSALDPIATAKIEETIDQLRKERTIILITHNLQQAARVSQRTAFFHLGQVLEIGNTEDIFVNPQHERCQAFIRGLYG